MKLQVGNVGMPGAPILTLNLGVYAPTGQANGEATITQASSRRRATSWFRT